MFIAHMPAGYLLTRYFQHKTRNYSRGLMWTGLIASIFPDFDLAYFFLIDHRQHPHHEYLTHMPLVWAAFALLMWGMAWLTNKPKLVPCIGVVLSNVLLHMAMDSIMAGIYWLYPFSDIEVNLLHITKHYDWWVLNFVLHWTFMLEIFIVFIALNVWITNAKKYPHCR